MPWRFRLLAFVSILALLIPRMTQRGMFLDGVTYAVVARNLAIGLGSFWRPFYTSTVYPEFYEQLPLAMALQSLFFRMFGDHAAVERCYAVVVFLVHALLVVSIWRLVLPKRYDSLPIFFWLLPSVVTWSVINNTLENTQALFTTLAVFCLMLGIRQDRIPRLAAWAAIAGFAIIAAVLAKGPVGFFPLFVPPLLLMLNRNTRLASIAVLWGVLLATVGTVIAVLYASDAPRHAITEWATTHLMPALEGGRGPRWTLNDLSRHLTMGILGRMIVLSAIIWAIRWKVAGRFVVASAGIFFFFVGLIASAPVLISTVLAGMYFMAAVPFFALAVAAATLPAVQSDSPPAPGVVRHVPVAIAIVLIIASAIVIATQGSLERRDVTTLEALDAVAPALPRDATIGTCENAKTEWGLHAYMHRFYRVSLDASGLPAGGTFLIAGDACAPPPSCRESTSGGALRLYACDTR